MHKNFPMVPRVIFGRGAFDELDGVLAPRRDAGGAAAFLVDDHFTDSALARRLPVQPTDRLVWVNVDEEPKTTQVDALTDQLRRACGDETPSAVIGIGGGSTMDIAKAVALMLTHSGSSADYQGWDLIRRPGVYHVGIPTLAGTGAEVSRTAVLTGPVRKLGLNSDHTVFDQVLLDPELIGSAPADQRFYTGMDCYIHNVESLGGEFGNVMSRAFAEKSMELCREVFLGDDERILADEKLMVASYYGGMSIAWSQVGVCHALSYGLSYVLGVHHGEGNCLVFDQLEEFYPAGVPEFRRMADRAGVRLRRGLSEGMSDDDMQTMVRVALSMEPLWQHALGSGWKQQMPPERVIELYRRM